MADESKGKGKGKATAPPTSRDGTSATTPAPSSGGARSAAQTLASALRTSMASAQLGSLMQSASGGKADFAAGGSGGELRDWLVQDLRSASANAGLASGSAVPTVGNDARAGSFRSTQIGDSAVEQEHKEMYDQFERGLRLDDETHGRAQFAPPPGAAPQNQAGVLRDDAGALHAAWDNSLQQTSQERARRWQGTGLNPADARPLDSYAELDAPFHASVRSDHAVNPASTSRAPAPPVAAPLAQTDDIFALLDAEERTSAPAPAPSYTAAQPQPQPQSQDSELAENVLSRFDNAYRAPSPSNSGFSREQAALHLSLAEAQASEQGRQELAVPRPDNPASREGVYAATAADALKSVFDGRDESTDVTEQAQGGETGPAVVRKITRWFAASSYLDDVYGLPPLLRETIDEAVRDDASEEKRQKAIRRLESLWHHLSNTKPQPGSDWVDGWLRSNT